MGKSPTDSKFVKLLFVYQGSVPEDQVGYHRSFLQFTASKYLEDYSAVGWLGLVKELGWSGFVDAIKKKVVEFQPDAIYFQFFHAASNPALSGLVDWLKSLQPRPLIAISGGDAFDPRWWMKNVYPGGFIELARIADVTAITAMGRCADFLERRGVKNIMFLPPGGCQVRFGEEPSGKLDPEFDLIFVGRLNHCRNPRSFLFVYDIHRKRIVNKLSKRYGTRFGLFGPGWKGYACWQGPVPYADQVRTCQRGRVIFGGYPAIFEDYYASDRVYNQTLSGVPLVDWKVPRIESVLRDNTHVHLVTNEKDLCRKVDSLLDLSDAERERLGDSTRQHILSHLTQEKMMEHLCGVLRGILSCRKRSTVFLPPKPDFFLPEIGWDTERKFALRAW